jgi:hypothetical protein
LNESIWNILCGYFQKSQFNNQNYLCADISETDCNSIK